MKLEKYLCPESVEECLAHLKELGNDAALLAGGTDLIPKMRNRLTYASAVIDLARIPELNQIESDDKGVTIGPMCRLSALQKEKTLAGPLDVVRQCAGSVSSMQVRNMATLGGNICNASPAADTVPGLLVLGASAIFRSPQGAGAIPLESFFTNPGETVLKPNELLIGVLIPQCLPKTGTAYRKYAIRGNTDLSIIGVAALVSLESDGRIAAARVALASAGPTPLLLTCVEQVLSGKHPEASLLKEAADACAENCAPITDQRATAGYRKEMVRVWAEDAIKAAIAMCKR